MVKCWAAVLGGCSATQSKEHYISRAFWKDGKVTVKGFAWLGGEEKTVGVDSLTARILCERHNNALSPLDSEATNLFHTIEEMYRVNNERGKVKLSRSYWKVGKHYVNGTLFERWAAKYLTGIFCVEGKDSFWHEMKTEPLQPPAWVVRAVYGREDFEWPAGLYLALTTGDQFEQVDGGSIAPLFHPEGGLIGGHFEFKGLRFIIWLSKEPIESFTDPTSGSRSAAEGLTYRLKTLQAANRRIITQKIYFEWKDEKPS